MGYDIPKGTTVFVNVWAIGRDPNYCGDGEAFRPERFDEHDVDLKGTNYEFLPFGSGRRMCPGGVNLGLANMNLVLVSLLYHFDWKLPDGIVDPKDIDIQEAVGLIAHKKTNLVLHPVTRIAPANAYVNGGA
jgi:cytochrome P450